jgi:hypothetical protein
VFCLEDDDVEIRLGSLDAAPFGVRPEQEIWVTRREPWQHPLSAVPQHDRNADT